MTSNSSPVRPPRAAAWLVELFASTHEADGVLGDLAEEFSASVVRDGDGEARRRYQIEAWRTIKDLALSPLHARLSSNAAITAAGLMLTAVIGLAGFVMTWPMAVATNMVVLTIVRRYPVYQQIPASLFWGGVHLFGPLMTGVLVALVARNVRFRPMSAALPTVAVMAVVFAVDRPIMMWLYGPPLAVRITLASSVVRWVRGVLTFGGVMLIGAAIGRLTLFRNNSAQLPPSAQ
jgi:hypothetical protein